MRVISSKEKKIKETNPQRVYDNVIGSNKIDEMMRRDFEACALCPSNEERKITSSSSQTDTNTKMPTQKWKWWRRKGKLKSSGGRTPNWLSCHGGDGHRTITTTTTASATNNFSFFGNTKLSSFKMFSTAREQNCEKNITKSYLFPNAICQLPHQTRNVFCRRVRCFSHLLKFKTKDEWRLPAETTAEPKKEKNSIKTSWQWCEMGERRA